MSFGKRQLILAALVVSLGAAVYLNWQFGGGGGEITAVDGSVSDKELGTAQLVNGSPIVSGEESVISSASSISEEHSTPTESEAVQTDTSPEEDYFSKACLSRQKTRDEAVELLNQVLNDSEATPEETQRAVEESADIAKNMLSESNIESMVKSKGYTDCVAFIQNDECNIVVGKSSELTAQDAATIQDIVVGQSDISADQVKIVDHLTAEK